MNVVDLSGSGLGYPRRGPLKNLRIFRIGACILKWHCNISFFTVLSWSSTLVDTKAISACSMVWVIHLRAILAHSSSNSGPHLRGVAVQTKAVLGLGKFSVIGV